MLVIWLVYRNNFFFAIMAHYHHVTSFSYKTEAMKHCGAHY